MPTPTASVIVCVYNRQTQIISCLDSLLQMDFQDFELILVDDGPTDETNLRLKEFRDSHPDRMIVLVELSVNGGLSAARNAGIRVASAPFVFFTDSDCIVDRKWLSEMLAVLKTSAASAVAGFVMDHPPRNYTERSWVGMTKITNWHVARSVLPGNNMGFRREIIEHYLFDPAFRYYCDDDDVSHRLRYCGEVVAFAPNAIVYHNHPITFAKYLRMGYIHGQGAARLWYKHGLLGYLMPSLCFIFAFQ